MTEDNYGGPLYVPEIDGERGMIVTDEAARALAEPGFPINKASAFFRNLARAGLVHPYSRQKSGKRAYYYRPDQVLIAAIHRRLSEAGIAGEEQRHATSLALTAWRAEDLGLTAPAIQEGAQPRVYRSPAMWALVDYLNGERNFAFHLLTQHNPKNGDKFFTARICNADGSGTSFLAQKEWESRSLFTVDLDPVLAHLTRPREVAQ